MRKNVLSAISIAVTMAALILTACSVSATSLSKDTDLNKKAATKYNVIENTVNIDRNGQNMVGTLALPEALSKSPVVVILHGLEGDRNEMKIKGGTEFMYQKTARVLAEQGYASLRIDFIGSGESDGKWEDTTVSAQIEDALAAVEFVKSLKEVDGNNIALLGLSQGGEVAACAAGRGADVKAVILWSPVSNPQFTYPAIYGMDVVMKGVNSSNPQEIIETPYKSLKAEFFKDVFMLSPPAEIVRYKGPLQVVVGLADEVVNPQPTAGKIFLNYHDGEEELITLAGTDHMLNIDTDDCTSFDQCITDGLTFLAKYLK